MERHPKISVITVVRNDVQHIEETMSSVLNQTYPNIEYIVIDGASTDGTWEKIQQYNGRLAYSLSEPDKGIYDAMNKGIKVMTGDWCIFMNCGDSFYDNEVVSKVFCEYKDQGESLIYGDTMLVNGQRKREIKALAQRSKKKECMPSYHQSIFIRAFEMKSHPYDLNYRIIADFAFFYKLKKRNDNYLYVPLIIASYDANGLSKRQRNLIVKEKLKFYIRQLDINAVLYLIMFVKRSLVRAKEHD